VRDTYAHADGHSFISRETGGSSKDHYSFPYPLVPSKSLRDTFSRPKSAVFSGYPRPRSATYQASFAARNGFTQPSPGGTMGIYIYIHVIMYIYTCVYIFVFICIYIYIYMYASTYIFMYININISIFRSLSKGGGGLYYHVGQEISHYG
jgi:hypothetical protein